MTAPEHRAPVLQAYSASLVPAASTPVVDAAASASVPQASIAAPTGDGQASGSDARPATETGYVSKRLALSVDALCLSLMGVSRICPRFPSHRFLRFVVPAKRRSHSARHLTSTLRPNGQHFLSSNRLAPSSRKRAAEATPPAETTAQPKRARRGEAQAKPSAPGAVAADATNTVAADATNTTAPQQQAQTGSAPEVNTADVSPNTTPTVRKTRSHTPAGKAEAAPSTCEPTVPQAQPLPRSARKGGILASAFPVPSPATDQRSLRGRDSSGTVAGDS